MKKLKWVMINIIPFVLIILLLFVPLFKISSQETQLDEKVIYGFHFVAGYSAKVKYLHEDNELFTQIISSKVLGLLPCLLYLSIYVIDKASKVTFGKFLVNFLCSAITFVYVLVLPLINVTFINSDFSLYGSLDFTTLFSYWIVLTFVGLAFVYYTIELVIGIKQINKMEQQKDEYYNSIPDENK